MHKTKIERLDKGRFETHSTTLRTAHQTHRRKVPTQSIMKVGINKASEANKDNGLGSSQANSSMAWGVASGTSSVTSVSSVASLSFSRRCSQMPLMKRSMLSTACLAAGLPTESWAMILQFFSISVILQTKLIIGLIRAQPMADFLCRARNTSLMVRL